MRLEIQISFMHLVHLDQEFDEGLRGLRLSKSLFIGWTYCHFENVLIVLIFFRFFIHILLIHLFLFFYLFDDLLHLLEVTEDLLLVTILCAASFIFDRELRIK